MQQELGEQKLTNADLRRSMEVLRDAIQPLLPRGQTLPTMYVFSFVKCSICVVADRLWFSSQKWSEGDVTWSVLNEI